jgi:CO/xanthine dehydrogenase Mo-binding subunit
MSVTLHINLPDTQYLKLIQTMVANAGGEMEVYVPFTVPLTAKVNSYKRFIEIADQIAKSGGIKSIPDPVAWQREQRKDRDIGRGE